jgi:hypothetical protein
VAQPHPGSSNRCPIGGFNLTKRGAVQSLGAIRFSPPTGNRQQKPGLSRGALRRRPASLTRRSGLGSKLISILPHNVSSQFQPDADAALRIDKRALGGMRRTTSSAVMGGGGASSDMGMGLAARRTRSRAGADGRKGMMRKEDARGRVVRRERGRNPSGTRRGAQMARATTRAFISPTERHKLLLEPIAAVGDGPVVRPPFHCDYGFERHPFGAISARMEHDDTRRPSPLFTVLLWVLGPFALVGYLIFVDS